VHAAAITRDELDWPVDRLPAAPSYEFSGVVVELGPGVVEPSIDEESSALRGSTSMVPPRTSYRSRRTCCPQARNTRSHPECGTPIGRVFRLARSVRPRAPRRRPTRVDLRCGRGCGPSRNIACARSGRVRGRHGVSGKVGTIEIAGLADRGALKPAIDSVLPLAEAPAAFKRSLDLSTRGKVILRLVHD